MADAPLGSPPPQPPSLDPNAGLTLDDSAPATPTTSAPTEYWGRGFVKEDGTLDHTRFEKAPEDLRDLGKDLSRFKSFDEMAKAWKERGALLGKKGISEPLAKDATPEQRAEHVALVRKALGAPDKPEGYADFLKKPDTLPEEMWNQEAASAAAKLAFEEGVSPQALQKFAALQLDLVQKGAAAQAAGVKEWFDGQDKAIREYAAKEGLDYAKAKDLAERAGAKFGIAATNPAMKNASVFMALARIGKAIGEDKLIQGDTSDDALRAMNPTTAQAALDKIRDDRGSDDWCAYWNRTADGKEKPHPRHDEVVAKAKQLSQLANANRPMRGR